MSEEYGGLTESQIDTLRLSRAIEHLVSAFLSGSLFIFCIIKGYKKAPKNQNNKCKKLNLNSFSVTDWQVIFMTFADTFSCFPYFALFNKEYILDRIKNNKTLNAYDYYWACSQTIFENSSLITYALLSIYSIGVIAQMITQTRAALRGLNGKYGLPTKRIRINCLAKNERIDKIVFICLQTIIPIICTIIPLSTNGFNYGNNLSLWPFLDGEREFTIYFYYIFVIIACTASIIQFIIIVCSFSYLKKLKKVTDASRKQSSAESSWSAFSSNYESDDDFFDADQDFYNNHEDSTTSVNSMKLRHKKENAIYTSALIKNLTLTLCFAIEWWPPCIIRIMDMLNQKEKNDVDKIDFQNKLFFNVTGPCLCGIIAILYYLRLGITVQCNKKSSKNKINKKKLILNSNPDFMSLSNPVNRYPF